LAAFIGLLTGLAAVTVPRVSRFQPDPIGLAWAAAGALVGVLILHRHLYNFLQDRQVALLEQPILVGLALVLLGAAGFAGLFFLWSRWLGRPGWLGRGGRASLFLLFFLVIAIPVQFWIQPAPVPIHYPAMPADLKDAPNVLLIVADTLRADPVSCDGDDVPTPYLDALAADGVCFAQAVAQSSWTKPSFGTIFTSLYPSSHTAVDNVRALPEAATTLAEVLAEAGYLTAGLANNPYLAPRLHFDQGFLEYAYVEPDYYAGASRYAARLAIYKPLKWVHLQLLGDRYHVRYFYKDAAAVDTWAMDWLERHREDRFFLFLHYMDPHRPYFEHPYTGRASRGWQELPLDPALAAEARSFYDSEVRYLDAEIGRVLEWLRRDGLYEDMLIVFTSDHGEEFLEHGGWDHGTTLYEEAIHVPLVIKYPGGVGAGTVVHTLARCLDLAPTIIDVAGLSVPEQMEGQSLWTAVTPPDHAFSETEGRDAQNPVRALRGERYKWIRALPGNNRGLPPTELFDLQADPAEQVNLAGAEHALAAQWDALLGDLLSYIHSTRIAAQESAMDEQMEELLQQLGY
jgi:arylsulfatase A-like enzyme